MTRALLLILAVTAQAFAGGCDQPPPDADLENEPETETDRGDSALAETPPATTDGTGSASSTHRFRYERDAESGVLSLFDEGVELNCSATGAATVALDGSQVTMTVEHRLDGAAAKCQSRFDFAGQLEDSPSGTVQLKLVHRDLDADGATEVLFDQEVDLGTPTGAAVLEGGGQTTMSPVDERTVWDPQFIGTLETSLTDEQGVQDVHKNVRRRRMQIKWCHEEQLKQNRDLSGTLAVTWTVAANGKPTDVSTVSNTTSTPELATCAENKIKGWTFPEPDAPYTVTWSLEFTSHRALQPGEMKHK